MSSVRLHPTLGVNPRMMVCPVCGEAGDPDPQLLRRESHAAGFLSSSTGAVTWPAGRTSGISLQSESGEQANSRGLDGIACPIGRILLRQVATTVVPDTILLWHPKLVAADGTILSEMKRTHGDVLPRPYERSLRVPPGRAAGRRPAVTLPSLADLRSWIMPSCRTPPQNLCRAG